jgi:DNA-binding NarL/FixJ family response regulator
LRAYPEDAGQKWCHDGNVRSLLIVDDHDGFRAWARDVLTEEGFDVVGEAGDGRSAIEAARRLRPSVVLLDIQLPDMSGFEVADRLAGTAAVVLTSSRAAVDYGPLIGRSPAAGFVPKVELSGATLLAVLAGEAT